MKKALTILLIAAILLPCLLTSCSVFDNLFGKQPEETTPTVTTPDATTPDATTPEATTPEQTTPEQTTPDDPIIIPPEPQTLKLTTVNVTTGDDPSEAYASAELQAYLIKKGISLAEDGFPIFIGIDQIGRASCRERV